MLLTMMWTKLDAKVRQNRKIKKAIRRDPMAVLLWVWILVGVGHEQTDGFVTAEEVEDAAHDLHMDDEHTAACLRILVDLDMLHDKRGARRCHDCCVVVDAMDGFYAHDFTDYNPTREQAVVPIKRLRWDRAQGLKHDRPLTRAIQERDGDRCSYCDVQVDWSIRRGEDNNGGTYDHIDPNLFSPNLGNTMENVVVACRTCNGRKRDRTPEEWHASGGLLLLRDPRGSNQTKTRLGRDQVSDPAATGPRGRGARKTGRAGERPGRDLVADQITVTNTERGTKR